MEVQHCWNCDAPAAHSLFCKHCNTLQRPRQNYYSFLGLEPKLSVDLADLQRRFYRLSRLLHPDRYLRRSQTERQYSLEATAILNDAYRVLRDPVARAEYMLRENGFEGREGRSNDVPPELLEEVFELNLAVEELRGGDDSARPQLEEARKKFVGMRDEIDHELETLFQAWDEKRDRQVLGKIRSTLNRRNYIRNLVSEVDKTLAA